VTRSTWFSPIKGEDEGMLVVAGVSPNGDRCAREAFLELKTVRGK
jgi:hypothetical protein